MKAKHYILLIFVGLTALFLGLFVGLFVGKGYGGKPPCIEEETVETTVDSIVSRVPVPKSELISGIRFYTLPNYRFIRVAGVNGRETYMGDSINADTCVYRGKTIVSHCDEDSLSVGFPTVQRHYVDSIYEAWVSGPVDPRLDSLRVYVPATVITRHERNPPKRWHVGLTAGYGYGAKGFQPFIGVGITCSLISF